MGKALLALAAFSALLLLITSTGAAWALEPNGTRAFYAGVAQASGAIVDTIEEEVMLAPGEIIVISYNGTSGQLITTPLAEPPLPDTAFQAVEKAPPWLRWKLLRAFYDMMKVEIDERFTGSKVSRPALADFNGDGLLDLFIGLGNGKVMYLENVGTAYRPLFLDKSDLLLGVEIPVYEAPASPAPVDLDGDGLMDMAVGREDGKIDFWWNRGTRTLPRWRKASYLFKDIDVGRYSTPFFIDLDGDGLMDLVVGSRSGQVHFYWNRGSPTAPSWVEDETVFDGLPATPMSSPALFRTADGTLWLAIGMENGTICLFKNVGTATSPSWEQVPEAARELDVGDWAFLGTGDLNGDGKPDLVAGNSAGDVFFARNEGTLEQPLFVSRRHGLEEIVDKAGGLYEYPTPHIEIHDPVFFYKWYLDAFLGPHYYETGRTWYGYYPDLDKLMAFREHYTDYVDFIARFLLNVSEPYVDEIAYWIANEQVNLLRTIAYYAIREGNDITGDYLLNVQSIYETAELLPYVRMVEHPEANYTTIAFLTENGTWFEVDPYIYYQHLMMPNWNTLSPGLRLQDYYEGHFFRTTLLYDDRYGVSLYDLVKNASTPFEAARRIHNWSWYIIEARWDNYGSWRVRGWWQIWTHLDPVRKDSEVVMCGEFATITECWLRSVLIPAVEALNEGEDHVWVEFYAQDGRWHHMDTTGGPENYFDNPRLYEEGWRKNVSAVYWADHGGRYEHPVLSPLPYTYKARVVFKVRDPAGRPVDGARIEAWSHWLIPRYGFAFMSFYNYTNEDGEATLHLGYNNYTFLIVSRYGHVVLGWPYPNMTTIYENQTYVFEITLPRERAEPPGAEGVTGLPSDFSQYHLAVDVELLGAYQYAPDVTGVSQCYRYQDVWDFVPGEGAYISVYVLDGDGCAELLSGHGFTAFLAAERGTGLEVPETPLPEDVLDGLCVVISNAHSETTYKLVRLNVTVIYDDKPPTVIIHEPEDGAVIDGDVVTVVFSSPDPDVHHFEISVDDGTWQEAASPYNITGLPKGRHTIRVRAIDISGLVGEASVTITLDHEYLAGGGPPVAIYAIIAGVGAAAAIGSVAAFKLMRRS